MNKWKIFIATTMTIAVVAPAMTPSTAAAATTHVVKSGDNLSKIAITYKVTVAQLKAWNNLTTDALRIGQHLIVSQTLQLKKGTLLTSTNKTSTITRPNNANIARADVTSAQTYTIVKGDTLSKIASIYNTTVSNLKMWNGLKNDLIYVGQVLSVSAGEVVVNKDQVEADIDFTPVEVSSTDQQIANQLAKEQAIVLNPSATGLATYQAVIELGHSLKGIPYLFGGNTTAGFDCSGYINYVFSKSGLAITRKSSLDYFLYNTTKVTNPIPGDVVFFKNTYLAGISHMGIYIGDGQFLHAGSKGVEVSKLSYTYWKERFVAYKRFNGIN